MKKNKVQINATKAYKKLIRNKYSKYPKILKNIKFSKKINNNMKDCILPYDSLKDDMDLIRMDYHSAYPEGSRKHDKHQLQLGKEIQAYTKLPHGKFIDAQRMGEIHSYVHNAPKGLLKQLGFHDKSRFNYKTFESYERIIDNKTKHVVPLAKVMKKNQQVLKHNQQSARQMRKNINQDLHNEFKSQKPAHKQYKKAMHQAKVHQEHKFSKMKAQVSKLSPQDFKLMHKAMIAAKHGTHNTIAKHNKSFNNNLKPKAHTRKQTNTHKQHFSIHHQEPQM